MSTLQRTLEEKRLKLSRMETQRVTDYMAQVSERVRDRAKKKFVIGVLPDRNQL